MKVWWTDVHFLCLDSAKGKAPGVHPGNFDIKILSLRSLNPQPRRAA